jgi:hypothetical protein
MDKMNYKKNKEEEEEKKEIKKDDDDDDDNNNNNKEKEERNYSPCSRSPRNLGEERVRILSSKHRLPLPTASTSRVLAVD